MSVIAVKGIPSKWGLVDVVKALAKLIAGPFEPLNFTTGKVYHTKICYLRLSERLDPVRVVEKINSAAITWKCAGTAPLKFEASVPEHVPDLPLHKKTKIPKKVRDKLHIPELELPHEVIVNTHQEIFLELQYRYPGLYNLSLKTGHKLLDELAQVLGDRLKVVMEQNPDTRDSCFKLSKCYRKNHPHFGDFQLILSTLHRLQDASGAPRAQVQESELAAVSTQSYVIGNVPLDVVKTVCTKYSQRAAAAISAHVAALDCDVTAEDDEETIARKKVREELKKMMPFLPSALKQVASQHFIPVEMPHRKIRIYGEPFLPNREAMNPFLRRYCAHSFKGPNRSRRMYNLIKFNAEQSQYGALRAMDATVINGAKLTIRSEIPLRGVATTLRSELAAVYGGTPGNVGPLYDDD